MSCIIEVRVVPNASKQQWTLDKAGRLKCYLLSQPEKGLANKELVTLLAKALGVLQTQITIIAGATGRTKYVRIPIMLSRDALLQKLGIPKQMKLGGDF